MRFKKGVKTGISLQPEIISIFPLIERLCTEYGFEFVVTSGTEGRHKAYSKHYEGKAIDIRSLDFKDGCLGSDCRSFVEHLQGLLGDDYFVLQEKTHCHVQFNK